MLVREVIEIFDLEIHWDVGGDQSQVCRRIILRSASIVVYHPFGTSCHDEIVFSMVIIAVAHAPQDHAIIVLFLLFLGAVAMTMVVLYLLFMSMSMTMLRAQRNLLYLFNRKTNDSRQGPRQLEIQTRRQWLLADDTTKTLVNPLLV